jgi:glycosyltransferase involved in cell wall biosynthesis
LGAFGKALGPLFLAEHSHPVSKKAMKILHVNMASAGGGVEQYLSQLSRELVSRGHSNVFLYGENHRPSLALPEVTCYFIENITHTKCEGMAVKLARVQSIIDSEQPELVFIHQVLNPYLIELLTKQKPSLRFVHGFKMICPDGRKSLKTLGRVCPFPLSFLCQVRAYRYRCMPRNLFLGIHLIRISKRIKQLHQKRSRMIVASRFMKTILCDNGFKDNRIEMLPLFTHVQPIDTSDACPQEPVVMALGRIVPEKGFHQLIRAFSKIRQNASLVIAGEGPFLNDLKKLVEDLGESHRISFPGWLVPERLPDFYQKCSMVVVPSLAPESFGMVGLEAMAYQKPVIASNIGGIPDWCKDGETGFLVNPGDETALAEKMNLLIENPALAYRMGKKGRETVEMRFTPEIHVNRLLSIFEDEIKAFQSRMAT